MALTGWGIRKWLLKQPRPALLRLTTGEKSTDIIPKKGASWSRIGDSIAAVNPDLVEAFDNNGNLLRATRPQVDSDPQEAPEPPAVIANDPETARLTHFANLLHRAYEHTTNVAFTKLLDLVERMDARSDAIEQRLERTEANYRRAVNQQLADAFDRVDSLEDDEPPAPPNADLQTLFTQFLGGLAQAQSAEKPPTRPRPTNGKADA